MQNRHYINMQRKNSLAVFNCYFAFSIFYFLFGKYRWNIPSYVQLIAYVLICYLFLNIGYRYRPSRNQGGVFSLKRSYAFSLPPYNTLIRKVFWCSSIFLIIFQVAWVVVFFEHFSILNVLSSLGENYYSRLGMTFDSPVPIMQVRTMLWGLTLFSYPIGFLYYKQMSAMDRILLIVTLFIDVLTALNMGISKNIGDIVIMFIGILLLKHTVDNSEKKKSSSPIVKIAICLIAFLTMFQVIQSLRSTASTSQYVNPYGKFASLNDLWITPLIFGQDVSTVIDQFGLYVSHAYTGLAYALELPFKNTYLLGFSRALMEYVEQFLGLSLDSFTYNARIDLLFGWHDGQWWPTAFVWIGNAVSLWLVPLVLFGLGTLFRYLEDDFAKNGNIVTAALYCQIVITLVYLPCNLQIFQSRASLFGTIFLAITFLLRNKFNTTRK